MSMCPQADLPADRKERAAVLRRVKSGLVQVLVTTEMGSRGLDIPGVEVVVNFDVRIHPYN